MSYENPKYHTVNMCDKCGKEVGKDNLHPFPFLYKDMNDRCHKDEGNGYRQYFGCKSCLDMEDRISIRKDSEKFMKLMGNLS